MVNGNPHHASSDEIGDSVRLELLKSSVEDDFHYAQHQIAKQGLAEPQAELELTESQFDDAIRALFKRSKAKRRQYAVSTQTATVELSVITSLTVDAVWPAWTAIKDALSGRRKAVPVIVLLDDTTARGAFALASVVVTYELSGRAVNGGFSLIPALSGRGACEFAVSVNWQLWKAVDSRRPAIGTDA